VSQMNFLFMDGDCSKEDHYVFPYGLMVRIGGEQGK
jgi:hypothetical protein